MERGEMNSPNNLIFGDLTLLLPAARDLVRKDGKKNLLTEQGCKGGDPVKGNKADSKRLDVAKVDSEGNPSAVYDYKFGKKGLSSSDRQAIRDAVDNQFISITEIRPGSMPTRPYTTGYGAAYNASQDLGFFTQPVYYGANGGMNAAGSPFK